MDKLRALRCFCRIVETKSFAAAAAELDMVPSVLSKSIAALESELACKLLNRTTRRVVVTEAGANYYECCKRLLTELGEAEQAMREDQARPHGRLLVGIHPALIRLLMARIAGFTAAYPEITLETNLTSTPATLLDDRLDVLVTLGPLPDSTLGVRKLGMTRHILVASPGYLAAHGHPDDPRDLRGHAFIVSGRPDGPLFTRWTLTRGDESEIVFVAPRLVNRQGIYLQDACLGGAGIARLAAISVEAFVERGELIPLLPGWSLGDYPIHAVFPDPRALSLKARSFIDFVQPVLASRRG